MPAKDTIKDRLARYRQIKLTVVGRKSGRAISMPVWFVTEGEKLYLLPVRGSDTQWYRNVIKNQQIRIDARDTGAHIEVKPITDSKAVRLVVQKFREKYGKADVKKYYSKFDVALVADMRCWSRPSGQE
jgi:deazaflavin-dependent oxidoreductase (nitroreductase family)